MVLGWVRIKQYGIIGKRKEKKSKEISSALKYRYVLVKLSYMSVHQSRGVQGFMTWIYFDSVSLQIELYRDNKSLTNNRVQLVFLSYI